MVPIWLNHSGVQNTHRRAILSTLEQHVRRLTTLLTTTLAAGAILTACGGSNADALTAKKNAEALTGDSWLLTSTTLKVPAFQAVVAPEDQTKFAITFDANGIFNAAADCNLLTGTYTTTGADGLSITPGPTTTEFCGEGSFDFLFAQALGKVSTYTITADELTTTLSDGGTLTYASAQRLTQEEGVSPDGSMNECAFVSSADASDALGVEVGAVPLGGLVDATVGQILDKRVIPDAEECWVVGGSTATTGRIARQVGDDASGSFNAARATAIASAYFAGDVSGLGDQAFCTGMSEAESFGVLVLRGDTLVYVSLIDPAVAGLDRQTNSDGVVTSPKTCALAQEVAKKVLR